MLGGCREPGEGSTAVPSSEPASSTSEPLARPEHPHPELEEQTLADLQAAMAAGELSAAALVDAYLERIAAIDRPGAGAGPRLRSVVAINGHAQADAEALDRERAERGARGPLHGIPILLKDNIESRELPTTAGSLALAQNHTQRDAPVVARLREAGVVVLGKANLSEWANIRSNRSTSGWSATGGLTRNPYVLDRNTCGSSSGSAAAVAANLVAAAIGTETDGSIVCPSAVNGIVGLKPTVGLVSRTHIVPIAASQDTAGPMARTVADAATLLTVMAGSDPADPATAEADAHRTDYVAGLDEGALAGRRIGVMRFETGYHPGVDEVFEAALEQLRAGGAELVEIDDPPHDEDMNEDEIVVLLAELRAGLDAYLATTPPTVTTRTLAEVVEFNREHRDAEMFWFGQEWFERALEGPSDDDPEYKQALAANKRRAGERGIDRMLMQHRVELLVAPTVSPSWATDLANGDHVLGGVSQWSAVSGYPHLTVPMGFVRGLPVGISFMGPAWSDALLLSVGYAFEQRHPARRPPRYRPTLEPDPELQRGLEAEDDEAARGKTP